MNAPDGGDLLVAARAALLDALEALGPHRDAVVLIGAQAIYLQAEGPSGFPDADLYQLLDYSYRAGVAADTSSTPGAASSRSATSCGDPASRLSATRSTGSSSRRAAR